MGQWCSKSICGPGTPGWYDFNGTYCQDPRSNSHYPQRTNLGLNYLLKNAKSIVMGIIKVPDTNYSSIGNPYRHVGACAGLDYKFSEDCSLATGDQ